MLDNSGQKLQVLPSPTTIQLTLIHCHDDRSTVTVAIWYPPSHIGFDTEFVATTTIHESPIEHLRTVVFAANTELAVRIY